MENLRKFIVDPEGNAKEVAKAEKETDETLPKSEMDKIFARAKSESESLKKKKGDVFVVDPKGNTKVEKAK